MRKRLGLVLLLAACASPTEAEFEKYRTRPHQVDCGSLKVTRAMCPPELSAAVDCLNTALLADRDAVFTWTVFTVEGDPIVHTAFTDGETQHVRYFVDTRADTFGPRQLTSCWGGSLALVGDTCSLPSPPGCN